LKRDEKSDFNVLNHQFVSEHELITSEEAKELLMKYHSKPYQLPYIKMTDPAVKALGAKPGDIIKIIRKSPTADEADTYRFVVED
jgi:DNA-directed RNA polymerase subunit H